MADKSKLWARRLWGKSKKRAKEAGIPFAITPDDIHVPELCPIFQTPIAFTKGISDSLPSLDRVDNAYGYVPGNVRVISWRANYIKKNISLEQCERMFLYMRGEL